MMLKSIFKWLKCKMKYQKIKRNEKRIEGGEEIVKKQVKMFGLLKAGDGNRK